MKAFTRMLAALGIMAALTGFWGCRVAEPTGTVVLSITDAPVDDPDIDGVWLTIGSVQLGRSGDDPGWESLEGFVGPQKVNLLDYQGGKTLVLGSGNLPSGRYHQIRFQLDIPDEAILAPPTSPGCHVSYKDGTTAPLFVPSGSQTGYKAVGTFEVPVNGTVNVTADFDLHKSLRLATNGTRYILQPTIRLVVDDQAGTIEGTVANLPAEKVMVFAYADGAYADSEAVVQQGQVQFPNSVAAAAADPSTQSYRIGLLAAGAYDLVVATVDTDNTLSVNGLVPDVTVESGKTTHQPIDMLALAPSP